MVLDGRVGRHGWRGIDLQRGRRVLAEPGQLPRLEHPSLAPIESLDGWSIQAWIEAPALQAPSPDDVAALLAALDELHDAGVAHGHLAPHHLRAGPLIVGIPRPGPGAQERDCTALAGWLGSDLPDAGLRRVVGALEEGADAAEALGSLLAPGWAAPVGPDEPEPFFAPPILAGSSTDASAPGEAAPSRSVRRWLWRSVALALPAAAAAAAIALRPVDPGYAAQARVPTGYEQLAARYTDNDAVHNCLQYHAGLGEGDAQVPALLTVERSERWLHGHYAVAARDRTLAQCILAEVRPITIPSGRFRLDIPLSL